MRSTLGGLGATAAVCTSLAFLAGAPSARAFTVGISAKNPKAIYLQVGVGAITGGNYNGGGTPGNNTTVNIVSVTVPPAQVGRGTPQAMTTNAATGTSYWDGYLFCNAPAQLYVGGFYRNSANTPGAATLTATAPLNLVNETGDTIPFTQISWTSSGNGDSGAQPFPAGTFVGGTSQTIGSINKNQWAESCHTFAYANSNVAAAGTFKGRVTYTLSTP